MKAIHMGDARRRLQAAALTAATVLAVTACGGGGSTSNPMPQNAVPVVNLLASQSIDQDTLTGPINFTVTDESPADVKLSVATSNPDVVPLDGITLSGSGANRTVTIAPAEDAKGQATVTIVATDAQGLSSSGAFGVTVKEVDRSIASVTNTTFAAAETETPAVVNGFTFVQDADDATTFDSLLQ